MKGAVKLHLLLDHEGLLPHYAVITEGRASDIAVARKLDLPVGSMLVFDRGYCDYARFAKLDRKGVHFVTRLKEKAAYEVLETQLAKGRTSFPMRPSSSTSRPQRRTKASSAWCNIGTKRRSASSSY